MRDRDWVAKSMNEEYKTHKEDKMRELNDYFVETDYERLDRYVEILKNIDRVLHVEDKTSEVFNTKVRVLTITYRRADGTTNKTNRVYSCFPHVFLAEGLDRIEQLTASKVA